jgi:hypothetical protein
MVDWDAFYEINDEAQALIDADAWTHQEYLRLLEAAKKTVGDETTLLEGILMLGQRVKDSKSSTYLEPIILPRR